MEAKLGELNHLSTPGTEINSYRKVREIPKVAASEIGRAQTSLRAGVEGPRCLCFHYRRTVWESRSKRVKAPYLKW